MVPATPKILDSERVSLIRAGSAMLPLSGKATTLGTKRQYPPAVDGCYIYTQQHKLRKPFDDMGNAYEFLSPPENPKKKKRIPLPPFNHQTTSPSPSSHSPPFQTPQFFPLTLKPLPLYFPTSCPFTYIQRQKTTKPEDRSAIALTLSKFSFFLFTVSKSGLWSGIKYCTEREREKEKRIFPRARICSLHAKNHKVLSLGKYPGR